MTVEQIAALALSSGALAAFGVWVEAWLEARWPWLALQGALAKRGLAWLITLVAVAVVFGLSVLMLWVPAPVGWRAWVTVIGDLFAVAVTANQGTQAVMKQRADKQNAADQALREAWCKGGKIG